MASVIHSLSNADFTTYYYHQVYVNNAGGTVLGESIDGPIVLDVALSSTGNTSGGVFLIGKKKPEQLVGTNSDGTNSIKG
jgi:hypothetical protein